MMCYIRMSGESNLLFKRNYNTLWNFLSDYHHIGRCVHGVKTSEKQVQFLGKLHAQFALKAKIRKSSLKLMFFQKKKFLTKTVSKGLVTTQKFIAHYFFPFLPI